MCMASVRSSALADQLALFAALYRQTHSRPAGGSTMLVSHIYIGQRIAELNIPPPSEWLDHVAVDAYARIVPEFRARATAALENNILDTRTETALRSLATRALP